MPSGAMRSVQPPVLALALVVKVAGLGKLGASDDAEDAFVLASRYCRRCYVCATLVGRTWEDVRWQAMGPLGLTI